MDPKYQMINEAEALDKRDFHQVPNPWFKRGNEIIEEGDEAFKDNVKFDDHFKSDDYSKEADSDLSYDLNSKTQRDFKANPNPWIVHNENDDEIEDDDISQEEGHHDEELIQE